MTTIETAPQLVDRALEAKRGLTAETRRDFAVSDLEVRVPDDGSHHASFYGHAAVIAKPYEMYGGPDRGGWNETVDRGAFKRTLNASPDVPFKVNHEGMNLARTTAGNLHLREDAIGLEVTAELDTRVSVVNDLVLLMGAGNINEMSFAFRVKKQTWLDASGEEVPWWDMTGIDRHLQELDIHKGDVSVVNYGANPFTDAQLRSLDETLRALPDCDPDELRAAIAYLESRLPVPPGMHPDLVAAAYGIAKRKHELSL